MEVGGSVGKLAHGELAHSELLHGLVEVLGWSVSPVSFGEHLVDYFHFLHPLHTQILEPQAHELQGSALFDGFSFLLIEVFWFDTYLITSINSIFG